MAIQSALEVIENDFDYPKLMSHRKRGNIALMATESKGTWLTGTSTGYYQTDLRIQDFTDYTGNLVMFNVKATANEEENIYADPT